MPEANDFALTNSRSISSSVLPNRGIPLPMRMGMVDMVISCIRPSLRKDWMVLPPSM